MSALLFYFWHLDISPSRFLNFPKKCHRSLNGLSISLPINRLKSRGWLKYKIYSLVVYYLSSYMEEMVIYNWTGEWEGCCMERKGHQTCNSKTLQVPGRRQKQKAAVWGQWLLKLVNSDISSWCYTCIEQILYNNVNVCDYVGICAYKNGIVEVNWELLKIYLLISKVLEMILQIKWIF